MTIEEGKILLIGNDTDILHCGFSFPLSEGGKRYPSADHYAHSMILTQLGLDEVHILELLATPSSSVPVRARELLEENLPAGHDMNSLAQYLQTSRQSYTMLGLRLRSEQDKRFRQALMETNDALLIVCDRRDNELGVGMDEEEFVGFTRRLRANAERISQWMHDERTRPREIGQNQLGFFLMWLRYEIKEKEKSRWMTTNDVTASGISTDQEDKPIDVSVSDFVIALQGIFQPLSNYYAMNFEIKGDSYRSVEHYAYQRLFESLKLSHIEVMKIRTTVKPVDVSKMARRLFKPLNLVSTVQMKNFPKSHGEISEEEMEVVQEFGAGEDFEIELEDTKLPDFLIVEGSQLENYLLQAFPNCRRLPYEKINRDSSSLSLKQVSTHYRKREIKWTQSGSNLTANIRCQCSDKVRWSKNESRYTKVVPKSKAYQTLLQIATKNPFLKDIDRLSDGSATSVVESYHGLSIKYKPKIIAFRLNGLRRRNMLATLDFNSIQEDEVAHRRNAIERYQCFSKAKRGMRWKVRKSPGDFAWKRQVVDGAERQKQRFGLEYPQANEEELDDNDEEDLLDNISNLFDNVIDSSELEHKSARLDRWRQSAMKHKISKNDYLQKLLLSTGHAILLETNPEGDAQWSSCTDEFEIQHLLTKKYVSPQLLIDWMCGRVELPLAVSHLGGNKTGLLLMELRTKFAAGCTHRIPLVAPLTSNVLRTGVSNHMICFTPESVLHPFYPTKVRVSTESDVHLASPIHVVAQMAVKFFNIQKDDSEWIMEPELGAECWQRLHYTITDHLMLPLEKIQQWYMDERQKALKFAVELQFDQNPSLLRLLLDTNDALLVSCARFSSTEAELNIGMRERDLRLWLSQVRVDSKQMIDICLRPMAFRPPYFGGNRLGLLLMEVRREFILKGVFPQQLPELQISVDASLGSDSPMENYVPHNQFDILNGLNYTALWANAFLLMAKQDTMPVEVWTKAVSRKNIPLLISVEEPLVSAIFEGLLNKPREKLVNAGDTLDDMTPEVARSIFVKITSFIRGKTLEDEEVQRLISRKSRESSRMQEIRRAAERSRDLTNRDKLPTAEAPQQWTPSASNNQTRPNHATKPGGTSPPRNRNTPANRSLPGSSASIGSNSKPMGGAPPDPSPKIPSLLCDLKDQPQNRFNERNDRRNLGNSGRFGNNNNNNRRQQQQNFGSRRVRSPSPALNNSYRKRDYIPGGGISPQRTEPIVSDGPPASAAAVKTEPPAPKKQKRVVDESELSEGEILSDDD
uniref:NADAR domain-containing protein n=1 Tax=Ditylenchus dipsaci TaxID=166011 RepID=A0A915D9X7_9BILA